MAKEVDDNVSKIVRKAALVADQVLVTTTRVDTGRARSNWIAELGQPSGKSREAFSPGEFGSTAAANSSQALAQASAKIGRFKNRTHRSIFITNNLAYIQKLDDEDGMVDLAIAAARAVLKKGKLIRR